MARIANNIAALNSWRQLTKNETMFSSSLEKLSSGYRINKAGDDPAGLVLSEQFRAQITGLKQAVSNTQDAASMIQTAEGNMQEMHSILNQIRGLVLHAKNTGVNDSISIAADQNQVDEAVNALNKIANNTFFGGKSLLNGSLGNTATVVNSTAIAAAVAGSAAPAGTNLIAVDVTTAATRATIVGDVNVAAGTAAGGNVTVNGYTIALSDTASQAATIAELQAGFTTNGLDLTAVANGNFINIRHNQYGAAYSVNVNDASNLLRGTLGLTPGWASTPPEPSPVRPRPGAGLTLTASGANPYLGMAVTLTSTGNAVATYANAISSTQGSLTFQVGSSASDTVSASIQDVRAAALGTTAGGATGLNAILTGATYNLTTDPTTALVDH
jgi:flagellin